MDNQEAFRRNRRARRPRSGLIVIRTVITILVSIVIIRTIVRRYLVARDIRDLRNTRGIYREYIGIIIDYDRVYLRIIHAVL